MAGLIRVLLLTASLLFPAASAWLNAFNAQCTKPNAQSAIECAIHFNIPLSIELEH